MAECDTAAQILSSGGSAPARALTGGSDPAVHLLPQLERSFQTADRVDILVSFLMASGVQQLVVPLRAALDRGTQIRILTGSYLGITQPEALYLLRREFGTSIDLRVYNHESAAVPAEAFHAKSYMFHYPEGRTEVYVGSSNVSGGALTSSIEWNYALDSALDAQSVGHFTATFNDLFENHSVAASDAWLASYAANWHKPAALEQLYDHEDAQQKRPIPLFQPRGAQIEALYALEQSRREGADKGLVQAATGIGKTFLAAFDSEKAQRVLFVAHREEILRQAARTFASVRPNATRGFFDGNEKTTDAALTFASASTLGRSRYLSDKYFARDAFDYVVSDEFHHAVTDQYRRIVDYFRPRFLLGLTATPERLDGRNIYELCDYNVPYEISLRTAINRGFLVPFHYYGIYDDTDYSAVSHRGGRYDEAQLTDAYAANGRRSELVYKQYIKHGSRRAIGFCCSIRHAELMAKDFRERGVAAAAVHSGEKTEHTMERTEALHKLATGELAVVFCVDILNEGVDVPAVDTVLFLRPTESPVVFLQQLGRGLRRAPGKRWLTVLDFIGNYERANRAPLLLAGEPPAREGHDAVRKHQQLTFPDDCMVDFDLQTLDLFQAMERRTSTKRQRIEREFYRVRELIGRRPSRMDLFTYMDAAVYAECMRSPAENPFRHYFEYLHKHGELTPAETRLYDSIAREFIQVLETTSMTKVYKMPVLRSFLHDGQIREGVTDAELLHEWKRFFSRDRNWRDFSPGITHEAYLAMTDQQHLRQAKQMPVDRLLKSSSGFFVSTEDYAIALSPELAPWIREPALAAHMEDILAYRAMEYYRRRYDERQR